MKGLSDFHDWFRDTVDPDDFAMSDDHKTLAVHEAAYEAVTGKPGLGILDPINYSVLVLGAPEMEIERFDELVQPTVRKHIVLEVIDYFGHTSRIDWKRACFRSLSREVYRDVFPTE